MARPKKYHTQQQRKAAKNASAKATRSPVFKGKYFRLVIPNLQDYKDQPQALNILKGDTLALLKDNQNVDGFQYYKIAVQTHTTGVPHLDILICYKSSVRKSLRRFDYLIKPGHLTKYKKLNQAILNYGDKQDPYVLTNFSSFQVLNKQQLLENPYMLMQRQMLKDPFHFNAHQWISQNNLAVTISKINWSKVISLLKHQQQVQCNKILHSKPGFQLITRQLIMSRLTPSQLQIYDSWTGYQTIVDHLNQIVTLGYKRPMKTSNLLITGPKHIGKTSLFHNPYHPSQQVPIQQFVSTYHLGMKTWWPNYKSQIYRLILWNQAKLTSYSYDIILKVLEGSYVDLPTKGSSVRKTDNPLVVLLSNMTLQQMVNVKFMNSWQKTMALQNLSVRLKQVIVPPNYDLFLLQKLIVL